MRRFSRVTVLIGSFALLPFVCGAAQTQGSAAEKRCVRLPGQCCFKRGKSCCAAPCPDTCHSIYIPRSPHENSSYFLVHARCDLLEIMMSGLDVGYEYQHSFQEENIATCMLGSPVLAFKGSQHPGRSDELIADQFGLSPLFEGFVRLSPLIVNHNFHVQGIWYSPPMSRCDGLFLRGQFSVTHQTRSLFDLAACTDPFVTVTQGPDFPPGAMSDGTTPTLSLREALSGTVSFGQMRSPWVAGRFTFDALSATGISGATLDVGYASLHHAVHAFSVFLRYRPATGTTINGMQKYASSLFFPVIGDGHFHQLGAGASMSGQLWGDDTGRALVIHCEGYAVHLFENCQKRSFDLKNHGCLSRYLLLKRFDKLSGAPLNSLIPALNITTRPVRVSIGAQGEVALQLIYKGHHNTLTIGYELYGKEREKLSFVADPFVANPVAYGIKGCTGTTYFNYDIAGAQIVAPADPFAIASNATSSNSTIVKCGVVDVAGGASTLTADTVGVDWTNPLQGNGEPANGVSAGTAVDELVEAVISNPAQYLSVADLDLCSGTSPQQLVHKGVIAYMHTWQEQCYTPYVAIGFEAEGSGRICTLKQYALWIKGGITF